MRMRILVKVGAAVLAAAVSSIAIAQQQAPYPMQSDSASSGTRPKGTASTAKRKTILPNVRHGARRRVAEIPTSRVALRAEAGSVRAAAPMCRRIDGQAAISWLNSAASTLPPKASTSESGHLPRWAVTNQRRHLRVKQALYQLTLTFIPYYAWANRQATTMQVWTALVRS